MKSQKKEGGEWLDREWFSRGKLGAVNTVIPRRKNREWALELDSPGSNPPFSFLADPSSDLSEPHFPDGQNMVVGSLNMSSS